MTGNALAAGLLAAGLASAAAADVASTSSYRLDIGGAPGTQFRATCIVERDEGALTVDLEGAVGFSRTFGGNGLDCTITQNGNGTLSVEARSPGGSISRSRTGGPNSAVRLRLR